MTAARGDAEARLNDLKYAQDQVERLAIRAPYDGIVQTIATENSDSLRPLQPGDNISAGQAVVTIAADTGFIVRARVDEQEISQVRRGEAARISGEDLGEKTLSGHVAAIGEVAQKSDDPSNTSRQIITTIRLDGSLPYLRDGMNVDVDIVTTDVPHVLAIASDAIRHDNDKTYVFVVRPDDSRTVKTHGRRRGNERHANRRTRRTQPGQRVVVDRESGDRRQRRSQAAPAPSPAPAADRPAARHEPTRRLHRSKPRGDLAQPHPFAADDAGHDHRHVIDHRGARHQQSRVGRDQRDAATRSAIRAFRSASIRIRTIRRARRLPLPRRADRRRSAAGQTHDIEPAYQRKFTLRVGNRTYTTFGIADGDYHPDSIVTARRTADRQRRSRRRRARVQPHRSAGANVVRNGLAAWRRRAGRRLALHRHRRLGRNQRRTVQLRGRRRLLHDSVHDVPRPCARTDRRSEHVRRARRRPSSELGDDVTAVLRRLHGPDAKYVIQDNTGARCRLSIPCWASSPTD